MIILIIEFDYVLFPLCFQTIMLLDDPANALILGFIFLLFFLREDLAQFWFLVAVCVPFT